MTDSAYEPETGPTWAARARLPELAAVIDHNDRAGGKNLLIDHTHKQALSRELGQLRGRRVLDFGCGTGRLSSWLVERGAVVEGLDTSEEMLAVARENVPDARFTLTDGLDLPVHDASQDIVLSVTVLQYHAYERERFLRILREMRRVLVPGGRLIALEQVHEGELGRGAAAESYRAGLEVIGFTVAGQRPVRLGHSRLIPLAARWRAFSRFPLVPRLVRWEARIQKNVRFVDKDYAEFVFVAVR